MDNEKPHLTLIKGGKKKTGKIINFPPPPDAELEEITPQKKPRLSQRQKNIFILAAIITLLVSVVLLLLLSPIFRIEQVAVSGNFRVSINEIHERLDIGENTHLFLFNTNAAAERLMENLYIGYAEFVRAVPNRLYVNITERRLTAYFEHMPGSFLYLDDIGRVLEMRTYFTEPLPVLVGLYFTRFQLGEILDVPDTAAFSVIVQYAQLLNHHGIINYVSHIDVSDAANIRIIVNNVMIVNVGGITDADEKVRTIAAILELFPPDEAIPGYIDLRDVGRFYIFDVFP